MPSVNTPFHTSIGIINKLRVVYFDNAVMHDGRERPSNMVKNVESGEEIDTKVARRGEASKVKRQAVKAVLKAFRVMLFRLLSPKCPHGKV